MGDLTSATFACQNCGRQFKWTAAAAGQSLRCGCGRIVTYPDENPSEAAAGGQPPQAKAAISPKRGPTLEYRTPRTECPATSEEKIKSFYMPLWLLGAGLVIEIGAAILQRGTAAAVTEITVNVLGATAVMLAGILLAARLRHIELGPFWNVVFKLSAISIAPDALVVLCRPILNLIPLAIPIPFLYIRVSDLVGLAIMFCFYFALLGVFFDLDESDTWYCVKIIFLIRLATFLLIGFSGIVR